MLVYACIAIPKKGCICNTDYYYRITTAMNVETDIMSVSPIERTVILVIKYVETYKTLKLLFYR